MVLPTFSRLFQAGEKTWLLTLVDQAVISLASFLTGIIIGRVSGKEQLGLYMIALTVIGLVMEFQEVLIWSPYTFFSLRLSGQELRLYTGSSVLHQVALSLVSLVPLSGLIWLSFTGLMSGSLASIIWVLIFVGAFIYFQEFSRHICFAGLHMRAALLFDAVASATKIGGLFLLIYFGMLSAARAIGVIGLACGLASLLWIFWARPRVAFSLNAAVSSFKQNWPFSKWIMGGNLTLNLSSYLFPWLLATFHNMSAVGVLAACQGVIALTNPFIMGSRNFIAPKAAKVFAHGNTLESHQFVKKYTIMIASFTSVVCVFLMVFGDHILVFLYGSQYGGQGVLIAVLSLNGIVASLPFVIDYAIWGMGRPDVNFKINLARLCATVTVGFMLVNYFDLLGVAIGLLLNSFLVSWLQLFCYLKLCQNIYRDKNA